MYRRELGASKESLPNELQAIWDAINRMRQEMLRSILPEGYTWDEDSDNLVVIQNGAIVSVGGGGNCDCEDGAQGPPGEPGADGATGPAGPQGPEGPTEFIKVAKWLVD